MRPLKADPIYFYSKEQNAVQMSIDLPEWTDFFSG